MKKILSLLTAISLSASFCTYALAADKAAAEPDVIVDGSKILFDDQNAKIINDITLVPARGVFEAMGCKVVWNSDNRTVTVTSSTGVRKVVIEIDSNIMKINTYKSLMSISSENYTLEVPAQIMNDRTMIPLRAVSEAFDAEVKWDSENYKVNITSGKPLLLEGYNNEPTAKPTVKPTAKPADNDDASGPEVNEPTAAPDSEPEDDRPSMSLSTDKINTLSAGDEFNVYITVNGLIDDSYLSAVVATFAYDKNKFEYMPNTGMLINDSDEKINITGVENPDYEKGTKVMYLSLIREESRTKDGVVFKATFKSKTGEPGTISLSNDFKSIVGYESYIQLSTGDETAGDDIIYSGNKLNLNSTPITIGE